MLKKFLRNLNIINAIIVVSIVLFVNYGLMPRLNVKVSLKPAAVAGKTDADAGSDSEDEDDAGPEKATATALSPQEFKIISDENLFHPDRQIVKYVPPKAEVKLPPPDFVLYGTLVTDTVKLAFLDDRKAPYTTPGGGKRHRTLKVGDTLSGFTLKEVDHEKVVMIRDTEEIVLKNMGMSADKTAAPGQPLRSPQSPSGSPRAPRSNIPASRTSAPAAPTAVVPPTIITVPAVTAQPAAPATAPAATTAPKPPVPAPGTTMPSTTTPTTMPRTQQQRK